MKGNRGQSYLLPIIGTGYAFHMPQGTLPGKEVVTMKTKGCGVTLRPLGCYKYENLNNPTSPLGDLATLIFSSQYVLAKIISALKQYTSTKYKETKVLYIFK